MAADLFNLNSILGAVIEQQMAKALNEMRPVWDPDEKYRDCWFVRRPQSFPDVVLQYHFPLHDEEAIIFGIELKGYYLFQREGKASFRFTTTPAACAPADLLAVFPWALSNIVSGAPVVFSPFVESALYAAEWRNYWWTEVRETTGPREVQSPADAGPYPSAKADSVVDVAVGDQRGRNFGRLARTGIMDGWFKTTGAIQLAGIDAEKWRRFFKESDLSTSGPPPPGDEEE